MEKKVAASNRLFKELEPNRLQRRISLKPRQIAEKELTLVSDCLEKLMAGKNLGV